MDSDLAELSKSELYDLASERGVEGRSKMSEEQLRDALAVADPGEAPDEPQPEPDEPEPEPAVLRFGDRGPAVRDAQEALVDAGYRLDRSGVFDARMAAAVRAVQSRAGIQVTGDLDEATVSLLR